MDTLLILPLMMVAGMVGQHFDRKAQVGLSAEEKARLLDFYTETSNWRIGSLVLLLLAFAGFHYFLPGLEYAAVGIGVFFVLAAAQALVCAAWDARKLPSLGLPVGYLAKHKKIRLGQTAASLLLFLWFGWSIGHHLDRVRMQMDKVKALDRQMKTLPTP
jgi:hypothetical protein